MRPTLLARAVNAAINGTPFRLPTPFELEWDLWAAETNILA